MSDSPADDGLIPIGTRVDFAKTIGESDIYLFAGITGEFDRTTTRMRAPRIMVGHRIAMEAELTFTRR